MTQDEKKDVVQQIYSTLSSKAFFDWYNSGNWDKYISADPEAPSYFEIVDEIESLFKVEHVALRSKMRASVS